MFCRKNSAGDGIFFLKTVRMCDPHRSDHTSNGKGEKKMDALNQAIAQISDVLWNSVLLFLLVGTGVYFSVRTRFVQVRKFKTAWNRVFGGFSLKGKKAGKDGMTSFQALATAIAAQVGTGNIAGCATALVSGGPGAIFWMWLAAFFGMATIYGEAYLAQTGLLHYPRIQGNVWKSTGRLLCRSRYSGTWLYGKYGTVELHQ